MESFWKKIKRLQFENLRLNAALDDALKTAILLQDGQHTNESVRVVIGPKPRLFCFQFDLESHTGNIVGVAITAATFQEAICMARRVMNVTEPEYPRSHLHSIGEIVA